MALRYIGVDPNTGQGESPTVWNDDVKRRFVFQGYLGDADLIQQVNENPAPGHAAGVPEGEGVFTMPYRMAKIIREALDAADELE